MSSISVKMEGDTEELLSKLKKISNTDTAGTIKAIAEGLRTSTVERFANEESPEGTKWKPSVRVSENGGKTLTKSAGLKTSIKSQSNNSGLAVGTNLEYAATHQYGADRTIHARKVKNLKFKVGGRWVSTPSVRVSIPARPFLGISKDDDAEIKEIVEEIVRG